jgi:hypothetical protein
MAHALMSELRLQPLLHTETADESAARASLRDQIARLERRLGLLAAELWEAGHAGLPAPASIRADACVLSLGELESVRDELADRISAGQRLLKQRCAAHTRARARLEAIFAEPAAHRFEILHCEQVGEPGCGAYQVLPRFGLLGMLFGWWCVKLSSGCP